MTNETKQPPQKEVGRQRSTIAFPYMDLNAALEVARTIHQNAGSGVCDDGQLAGWLNLSKKSSGYGIKLASTKLFGLITNNSGSYQLTPLGLMASDPSKEREAKVRAFLNVPLYKAIYDKFKGLTLPPSAGLENDIAGLGVAEKVKDRARQAFERSADAAGFFEHGKQRLVMPVIPNGNNGDDEEDTTDNGAEKETGKQDVPREKSKRLHPFIQGLLEALPDPDAGIPWPQQERKKWLTTADNIFGLLYKDAPANEDSTADLV